MSYILIKDGSMVYPFDLYMLQGHYPNTSFPDDLSRINLAELGVFPLITNPQPAHDPMVQSVALGVPGQQNGQWVRDWVVESKPVDVAARNTRNKRNDLLSASDWTQLADASVDKTSWAQYRQALRDLPSQSGFPYSITWPVAP
jgi:hypothetical protein